MMKASSPFFCLKIMKKEERKGILFLAPSKNEEVPLLLQKYAVIINVECPDMNINCVEACLQTLL